MTANLGPWIDCRCGHPRATHAHPRAGLDCKHCPCRRYRAPRTGTLRGTAITAALCAIHLLFPARKTTKGHKP